jgi:predicted PurR-regulated permease PerM
MNSSLPMARVSYALALLAAAGAVWLHLGPVILAGLFAYMILDLTQRAMVRRLNAALSRWLALFFFLFAAAFISWLFVRFLRQTLSTLPQIAGAAIPRVLALAESAGVELPFENAYELRDIFVRQIQENVPAVTKASGILTVRLFHIIIAVFIAIMGFFSAPADDFEPNLFGAVRRETVARWRSFMLSFEKVLGAQVVISSVNSLLTAVFLLAVGFPHIPFLVLATFILGMLPIVGNILSNIIIVGTALTLSPRHALLALGFLVVIHKGEYFLNSRIVGSNIKAPMWQTLLAILLGEFVMGTAGIVLAPAFLHFAKKELRSNVTDTSTPN